MDPSLHAVERALIDKPMDRALGSGRALRLEGTGWLKAWEVANGCYREISGAQSSRHPS
jgi:hypothetical protein